MTLNLRKIILILGFILLLLAIAYARPNPKICRNRNGKFPRPGTLCREYYECKNYVPVEKTCGDGEHFNANKGRCDWEDLYPCLEKQKDKECLRENGLFLKPGTNCKKYYRCCNGKSKVEACFGDLLFDPSKGKCEWPDLYTCIETQKDKECLRENGLFLKPRTNCKKYYRCYNGKAKVEACSGDLLFDPFKEKCEWPDLYTCVERPERKECPRRNGHFLKPRTNCKKFFNCSNGEPEEQRCPKNTLFNPATEKCESVELYTCIEKPERKECLKRNGKFLKPGTNCMKYYECSNGEPEQRKCRIGTLFNPATENCEMVEKYTCIESLSTTEKASSTVTFFATSTPSPEISTDPAVSKSTIQKTTTSNLIIYSTQDPDFGSTNSNILETSTKLNTLPASFQTSETSTISQTITSENSTTLEQKLISTSKVPTSESTTSESSSTISENLTTLKQKVISTTSKVPTSESTTSESSTISEKLITLEQKEISTSEIKTSKSTINESPSTTSEILTSQPISESSTLRSTTSEIPISSQTTSPQISSTHFTDHTILKENKESKITEPTIFETTIKVTFSPSTVEVTTSEVNIMCPEPNGYFPHPTDKHKFVGCVDNIPYIMTCPSDLVYKHNLKRCDH